MKAQLPFMYGIILPVQEISIHSFCSVYEITESICIGGASKIFLVIPLHISFVIINEVFDHENQTRLCKLC